MSSNPDFFRLLSQLYRGGRELRLLNIFKGLPILYVAKIDMLGDKTILVRVSKQQLACLYHQRETYLQSDDFPYSIRAQLLNLNPSKSRAELTHFIAAESSIGERTRVRVEPKDAPMAYLRFSSGFQMPAPLVDISPQGASITVHDTRYADRHFNPGARFQLSLSFPRNVSQHIMQLNTRPLVRHIQTPDFVATRTKISRLPKSMLRNGIVTLNTEASITSHTYNQQTTTHRIGMRLSCREIECTVVAQYIAHRQAEIIRDLRMLGDALFTGRIK